MVEALELVQRYSGALLLVATLLLAYFSWRLAREAIHARTSANVVLWPARWPENEDVAHFYLENHGNAAAERVTLRFNWGHVTSQIEVAVLAPGQTAVYAPDTLLSGELAPGDPAMGITWLADNRRTLESSWSWTDGRRNWWGFGRRRHRRSLRVDFETFRASVHGAPSVLDSYASPRSTGSVIPGVDGRMHRAGRGPRVG